ncbi:outer membrane beta-barrel protein [Fuchsiella alkaliacetigena]|uniref:outer membrane beta-barrel protein n=1 Tax=Fuchsiella alkaliacetigena TaxID=957042 RepID=UPI00200B1901|nr:outer membrane beta-barrel protein [Fuchsiella alkaliacetigena]MCK8825835.1 outer membrane beta-barrel protein [Fuchsiella alkaliacetigena]
MKKRVVISLLLVMIIIFVYQSAAFAERERFELNGGLIINTFALDEFNEYLKEQDDYLSDNYYSTLDGLSESSLEEVTVGGGVFIQGRYWLTENIALGGELKRSVASTKYELTQSGTTYFQDSYELTLTGASGLVVYKLPVERVNLNFQFGLVNYWSSLDWEWNMDLSDDAQDSRADSYTNSNLGGKFGLELDYLFRDRFLLKLGMSYQHIVFDKLENEEGEAYYSIHGDNMEPMEFDFSGLESKLGIVFKF